MLLELLLVTGAESVRLPSAPTYKEGGLLMRGTILLLATVAPALLLVGGVATSKQRQESISSQSPTSDKSGGRRLDPKHHGEGRAKRSLILG